MSYLVLVGIEELPVFWADATAGAPVQEYHCVLSRGHPCTQSMTLAYLVHHLYSH